MPMQMKDQQVEVICQHKLDTSIIPIKIKLVDEDGEYQVYRIQSYKDLTGLNVIPGYSPLQNHIYSFDCKISVFNQLKQIRLWYNAYDGIWRME